jgi:hypothetical protein
MTSDPSTADLLADPRRRAEDILLGSLGFGEEARLLSIEHCKDGYRGTGVWSDGETFEFESDDELSELETWALEVLCHSQDDKQEFLEAS